MSVKVGKFGRIILPKKVRKKYGLDEGMRLIITEYTGHICLVPVKVYDKPTEALSGSIKIGKTIDDPKQIAREYIRKKLFENL